MNKSFFRIIFFLSLLISSFDAFSRDFLSDSDNDYENVNQTQVKYRIACVGNSITQGVGASSRKKCYVNILDSILTDNCEVKNFGQSGATVCKNSYKPYNGTLEFKGVKNYLPNVVIIALGTNDSQPRVWDINSKDIFKKDLKWLCDEFRCMESSPIIFLCLPPYIAESKRWTHKESILYDEIIPEIKDVANEKQFHIIDLHQIFYDKPQLLRDCLHPNDRGHLLIALEIKKELTEILGL